MTNIDTIDSLRDGIIVWNDDIAKVVNAYTSKYSKKENKMKEVTIKNVIFNPPATIVFWSNGDKTVVKCDETESFDPEKGMAMAISKHALGNKGNYYNEFVKYALKYNNEILDEKLKECGEGFKGEIKENTKNLYYDILSKTTCKAILWTGENVMEIEDFLKPFDTYFQCIPPDRSICIRDIKHNGIVCICQRNEYIIGTNDKCLLKSSVLDFDERYRKIMNGVI